jgi:hypothetical protein
MTREGYNKHKEVFEAWLDGKQIQILGENGQWIDSLADVKWKEHKEYRVKPTKIEFEDCSFNDEEYAVNELGDVLIFKDSGYKTEYKKGFFKDKEIAEAYAVLPQLIRLRDEYNEGWKPNYKDGIDKYYIIVYDDEIKLTISGDTQRILVFETEEIRNRFLEDHKNLIKIAKPLL